MPGFDMSDYVPVNERVEQFYKAHPEGSIQSEIVELTESRVTVKAYAYRSADDTRPGIGHSSLEIPGKTTFTRGSEIENAETSAWGRAIAALGFEVKRGVSSAEEVRNKQPQDGERASGVGHLELARSRPAASPAPRTKGEALDLLWNVGHAHGLSQTQIEAKAKAMGINRGTASIQELVDLAASISSPSSGVPTAETDGGGGSSAPSPSDTSQPSEGIADSSASDAATTVQPGAPPPSSQAAPAPSMEQILEATGGVEVPLEPPKPGTDAYRLLPSGRERAEAKGYWDRRKAGEPEQETLAQALGAPVAE